MPEDEFRTELEWPRDPLGERSPLGPDDEATDGAVAAEVASKQDPRVRSPNPDRHDHLGDGSLLERLDALDRALGAGLAEVSTELAALRRTVDDLRDEAPAATGAGAPRMDAVLAELTAVREELVSLRRRVSLRADARPDRAVLSDEQLARLARSVADLLSGGANQARR